jgi:predicted DNA-binding transcriptional regulator AlpA
MGKSILTSSNINQISVAITGKLKRDDDDFLTIKEVARKLEIGTAAIRKRCRQGKLPYAIKNGKYYFSKRAITNYFLGE